MFGYIKPMIPELKVREHELYKSIYCGLCRSMGENICHSQRFTLSYDIVFLALVRAALTDENVHIEKKRCMVHPIKKRNHAFIPNTLKYCSESAAILTYYNILDDINDSKGFSAIKYKVLMPWAKKIKKKADIKALDDIVRGQLDVLSRLEKTDGSLDKNAEVFGILLGEIFAFGIKDASVARILYEIGFHCGKWIYIIDAADDFEKDKEKGEYNPLSAFDALPIEALEIASTLELAQAKDALERATVNNKALYSIINNILTLGMPETQDKIFKEKDKDDRSL